MYTNTSNETDEACVRRRQGVDAARLALPSLLISLIYGRHLLKWLVTDPGGQTCTKAQTDIRLYSLYVLKIVIRFSERQARSEKALLISGFVLPTRQVARQRPLRTKEKPYLEARSVFT